MSERHPQQDFFDMVFQIVRLIPVGRVTTYGAIANYLGAKSAARTVGWAMNMSHNIIPHVPAHRVVNRNGMLSGKNHFETPSTMQSLLEAEGLAIKNDCIANFEKHFWDPNIELSL